MWPSSAPGRVPTPDGPVTGGAPAAHTTSYRVQPNPAFPAGRTCTASGMGLQVEFKVVVKGAVETGTPLCCKDVAEPERPGHRGGEAPEGSTTLTSGGAGASGLAGAGRDGFATGAGSEDNGYEYPLGAQQPSPFP